MEQQVELTFGTHCMSHWFGTAFCLLTKILDHSKWWQRSTKKKTTHWPTFNCRSWTATKQDVCWVTHVVNHAQTLSVLLYLSSCSVVCDRCLNRAILLHTLCFAAIPTCFGVNRFNARCAGLKTSGDLSGEILYQKSEKIKQDPSEHICYLTFSSKSDIFILIRIPTAMLAHRWWVKQIL